MIEETEKQIDDLIGMDPSAAKDYILRFIAALKLTENQIREIAAEEKKWKNRAALARAHNAEDLAAEAEKETERIRSKQAALEEEAAILKRQIEKMRRQLPGLAARQRSIDPDLLEQELLMAAGRMPGEEKEAARDREFEKLEKEQAAQEALEALKTLKAEKEKPE
ncbi:MAG: chromosome partitioning protein [Treponema sp.]|jgi:phage shock protein A|nr:chromosome partitioning protein [Treponema sp.]